MKNLIVLFGAIALSACATTTETKTVKSVSDLGVLHASYYGHHDHFHGRRTANGEVFNAYGISTAHKTLPFGTLLHVTNVANGLSLCVRVNDRGPFVKGRHLDLSYGAAKALGFVKSGTARLAAKIVTSC